MLTTNVGASAGALFPAVLVPYPSVLKAVEAAAIGVSGAPQLSVSVQRFIPGTGLTTIVGLVANQAILAMGTSGPVGFSLATPGSTLLGLQAGDLLFVNQLFSGGNVAITSLAVDFVLAPTQDIVAMFGSST